MKKLFTFLFLLSTLSVFAQPANDDCPGIIDLGVVPFCPDNQFFTNEDATATDIGNDNIPGPGACGNNDITFVGNDVWFQFTSSDTITDYTITVTGMDDGMGSTAMTNPQIMIYRGAVCGFDELALLACGAADDGEFIVELDVLDLDPNEVYYIRINDFSSTGTPNWGSFLLCIDEIDPINTVDQGGSNACTGELYDTGGPDGDYMGNENNSFSICPPFGQNACVTFTLEYYNLESFNDQMVFYDGPDTNSPIISTINGGGNGTSYGGVCFTAQATSGCLTVEFISDGTTEFEGFAGTWECSAVACDPLDGLSVDNDVSDQDIIDNVSTPQTLVTIDTIICANGAYGTFATAGDNNELGLEKGLILTSGSVLNALGPNNQGGLGINNGFAGDADLDALGTGINSFDACIVELDVFVATDELVFEYVFASEEYPEFVGGGVNDVFALLISGPGIIGEVDLNGQENMATIPGTNTEVSIDNVNDGNNWEYYRDNENGVNLQYDGMTSDFLGIKKSLTARATVIPCNTYHLKLAIADRGDGIFDSGVFISEIRGGTPDLSVNFASGVDYLVEDCTGTNDELLITLSNALPDSATYNVVISGTAERDVDYTLTIPDSVIIAPGQTQLSFPIVPLSDGLIEGTETIIIQLTSNFGCGDIELTEITVEITDAPIVDIFTGIDTAFICSNECLVMEVDGAVDYFWEPAGIVDDPFSTNPEACPTTSQFLYVTGSISNLPGCSDRDTIWLEVVDPVLDIVALSTVDLCEGSSVQLQAVNNVGNTNLEWTPGDGLDATDQEIVTATPEAGTFTYTATVTIAGCSASDDITVTVDPFDFPELTTTDTLICQGQSVVLAENIPFTTTTYEWTPDTELEPGNDVSNPTATPQDNTTYTLLATSASGFCSQTATVDIEVLPAEINIMPEDTVYICKGEIATLTATTTTGMIQWSPEEGLDDPTSLVVNVDIEESQWYFAEMSVGVCTVFDSVFVRVDSIPELPITAIPDDSPYCPGEIVTLVSPTFEPLDYPDITHIWSPGLGAESALENLNLVISTVETTTYVRTTVNNACSQTDEILIEVVDAGAIDLSWTDTTICQGDPLMNEVFNGTDPVWSPDLAISCTECAEITITARDTIVYQIEVNIQGCPITADVRVNVIPDATGNITEDTEICVGESVILNDASEGVAGTVYSWTASPADATLDPNAPEPLVTPTQTTTYTLVATNSFCDPYTAEVTITVIENPVISFDPDITICQGEEITLNGYSTEEGGTFTWNGPGGVDNQIGSSINVTPSDTASYNVVYTDGCGNFAEADILVNVIQGVTIDIIVNPDTTSFPEGQIIDLTAVPDPSLIGAVYNWNTGATGQMITDTITVTPNVTYVVTVTSQSGCEFIDSITFDVTAALHQMPNAFTPNNDGISDFFNVVYRGSFEIVEFKIYSRWGKLVYDNQTPDTGWDGRSGDKDMPSDVYIYTVVLRRPSGEEIKEKGDITLIR